MSAAPTAPAIELAAPDQVDWAPPPPHPGHWVAWRLRGDGKRLCGDITGLHRGNRAGAASVARAAAARLADGNATHPYCHHRHCVVPQRTDT